MLSSDIAPLQVSDATPYRRSDSCAYQTCILRRPRSNFVCKRGQFFRKSCIKLSSMTQQKGRKHAPFRRFRNMPHSRRMRAERLTLRELERLACLGAAVFLALDGAGVAGEEATLLQHRAQVRLEIGQRLGDAMA